MNAALCAVLAFTLPAGATPSAAAAMPVQDTVRRGAVTFVHSPAARALAEALAARPDLSRLPVLPPDVLDGPPAITVHLAADEAAFESLTGGRAPEWGAGVAFPDAGVIVLPAYASRRGAVHELGRVLRHELAHVALQRHVGPLRVPRWFSEGYATWAAGQLDVNAGWILRLAFLTGRAPPLDSLTLDWPAGVSDARVAYLLSASAVAWLHDRGGDRVMAIFLGQWQRDRDFERALFQTYGLSLAQLERYWSADVRRRYGWLLFLAQSVVIWAITGILLLVMVMIRRRRDRARMARLRATEVPDDPAFWLHVDTGMPGPGRRTPDVSGPPPGSDDDTAR